MERAAETRLDEELLGRVDEAGALHSMEELERDAVVEVRIVMGEHLVEPRDEALLVA